MDEDPLEGLPTIPAKQEPSDSPALDVPLIKYLHVKKQKPLMDANHPIARFSVAVAKTVFGLLGNFKQNAIAQAGNKSSQFGLNMDAIGGKEKTEFGLNMDAIGKKEK